MLKLKAEVLQCYFVADGTTK